MDMESVIGVSSSRSSLGGELGGASVMPAGGGFCRAEVNIHESMPCTS